VIVDSVWDVFFGHSVQSVCECVVTCLFIFCVCVHTGMSICLSLYVSMYHCVCLSIRLSVGYKGSQRESDEGIRFLHH